MVIISHNVFWFQGMPFESLQPGAANALIVHDLGEIYRELHADAICLQEIQSEQAGDAISGAMRMSGDYCHGNLLPQYGGVILSHSGVTVSDACGTSAQRVWQISRIDGNGAYLTVCNLHLPSSRQLGPEGAAAQRLREIREILDSSTEQPDVVVGDFNEQPGGAVDALLTQAGYVDAAVVVGKDTVSTSVKGTSRGDMIWIRKNLAENLVAYYVIDRDTLRVDESDVEYLSDHLPLVVEFDL